MASSEEAGQTVTLSGRGIIAEWDDAIVYPYGGLSSRPYSDQRGFAWWSPELSTSGWPTATVVVPRLADLVRVDPPLPDPWLAPLGSPFIVDAENVQWIYSRFAAQGTATGSSLFRTTFTSDAERVSIFYTGSSRVRCWVDGIAVGDWTTSPNTESFTEMWRATPYVSSGTHHLAVEVDTQAWTPTLPGVARGLLLCAVYGGGGRGTAYSSANRLVATSSSWRCLDVPAVFPAPTPGKILSTLLSEAQARGALTGWALSCTDTVDSAGRPWSNDTAYVFRVGDTLLSVLSQMADVGIDYRARPVGKVLDVYRQGSVTQATGQSFIAGTNVLSLEEDQPL